MAERPQTRRWLDYAAAAGIVGVCTLLGGLSHWWALTEANIVMIFLAGVTYTAARFGHGPAMAAIVLSVVSYDFFFVPPVFAFAMVESQYVITLGVMVAIGLLISELTTRLKAQLAASQLQERRSTQLYRLTRELGSVGGKSQLLATAGAVVADAFDGEVVIYLRESPVSVALVFGQGNALAADAASTTTAQWVAVQGRAAGLGTDDAPRAAGLFTPMAGLWRMIGVLGVRPRQSERFRDVEERRMLEMCANLIALALERDQSAAQAHDAQVQMETEKLRNSLLTSISHDLRTPLATIAVTTSGLLDEPAEQTLSDKREVLETIVDETRQLGRQFDNLLDMGRLNSGDARLNCDWHMFEELVGVALSRLRRELAGRPVEIDIPRDFPMLWVAGDLMVQVLVNLLENAVRYTPAGTRIRISAQQRGACAEATIADDGPGLRAGTEATLFDKFVRGPTKVADGRRGLGLGLAICRSIVQAHSGEISARNGIAGGAEFLISLPCRQEAPQISLDGVGVDADRERVASERG